MTHTPPRVVYDCVIFAQALINSSGPAGECVRLAQSGQVILFVSDYLIREILELESKIPAKYGLRQRQMQYLADQILMFGTLIHSVPSIYIHPVDPDDSPYIDLAVAAGASIVVSRDRHLLNLMDMTQTAGHEFAKRYPKIKVITPDIFAKQLRTKF